MQMKNFFKMLKFKYFKLHKKPIHFHTQKKNPPPSQPKFNLLSH